MGVLGGHYFCGINSLEIELIESKAHLFLSVIDMVLSNCPLKCFINLKSQ